MRVSTPQRRPPGTAGPTFPMAKRTASTRCMGSRQRRPLSPGLGLVVKSSGTLAPIGQCSSLWGQKGERGEGHRWGSNNDGCGNLLRRVWARVRN